VKKSQHEEVKQAPDRESGKKRDSKKAVPQRGSTQPSGKDSVLKRDGRSGKFNKDESEEE
jgi:hypothetical protein